VRGETQRAGAPASLQAPLGRGHETKLEPDKYVDSPTERFRTRVQFPPPPSRQKIVKDYLKNADTERVEEEVRPMFQHQPYRLDTLLEESGGTIRSDLTFEFFDVG
jgi:hypothetical protein